MKNVIIFFFIVLISCINDKDSKISNIEEVVSINSEFKAINFIEWKMSVLKAIDNSEIEVFEKSNLQKLIDGITKDDFNLLQEKAYNQLENSGNNECVLFYYSQGETVKSDIIYIFFNEDKFSKVSISFEYGKKTFNESVYSEKFNLKDVEVDSISEDNIFQDILIVTKIVDGSVISNLGNVKLTTTKYLNLN